MSCNICEDDYGLSFCGCSILICEECAKKHIKIKNNNECPQCKKPLIITYFTSGKIIPDPCEEDQGQCGGPHNRVIVIPDNCNTEDWITMIFYRKCGGVDVEKEHLITYENYIDVNKPIRPLLLTPFSEISGPCVIVSKDAVPQHGGWEVGDYYNIKNIPEIVNCRNKQMIDDCDVFHLKINKNNDCYCSLTEWGYANAKGKILIISFDTTDQSENKEYYMLAIESINSFKKLNFARKHSVLKYCPGLNIEDYNIYEQNMKTIIDLKLY